MVIFLVSRACGQGPVFRVCFHVLRPQLSLQPWLSHNLTSENSPKYCPWVQASFQGRHRAVPAHKDRIQEGGSCVPEAPVSPTHRLATACRICGEAGKSWCVCLAA